MSKLQVLMPMGGLGSRFVDKGYTTPKPLIPVDGKPMFMRALDSFDGVEDIEHIFVLRRDHEQQYNLSARIKEQLPDAKIAFLETNTRGAVETCLLAADLIDDSLPIIIADCDIYFQSKEYFNTVLTMDSPSAPDGMLLTFRSIDPRYSYVETDSRGLAIRTAEKVVISEHAILGGYFFKSGSLFKDLASEFIRGGLPEGIKEFYLSHLFNILINRSGKIKIADIDVRHIFGTPEELDAYINKKSSNEG